MNTSPQQSAAAKSPFEYAAWLVDLDGTLYHQKYVRAAMTLELAISGWPAIKTLRAFRHEHERLRQIESALEAEPFALQVRRTAAQLHLPETTVTSTVTRWMIERPGKWLRTFRRRPLVDAIKRFRAQGGRTAIVSDYPAQQKLGALGIADLFDAVIACGEPGGPNHFKPRPSGFLAAANQLRISPADCLVIGDRQDADGEAARLANMAFRHATLRWS